MIDIGDIQQQTAKQIYRIDTEFVKFPGQAYQMHLSGILPSDMEPHWNSKSCQIFENKIEKLCKSLEYDARVVCTLQNNFVVDKIRAVDTQNVIIHLSIEQYLVDKKLGIESKESFERVKEMAMSAGVDFQKKFVRKNEEEKIEKIIVRDEFKAFDDTLCTPLQPKQATVEEDLINFSMDADEEDVEIKDKWVSAPSIEQGKITITTFPDPDNFYIQYKGSQ